MGLLIKREQQQGLIWSLVGRDQQSGSDLSYECTVKVFLDPERVDEASLAQNSCVIRFRCRQQAPISYSTGRTSCGVTGSRTAPADCGFRYRSFARTVWPMPLL